MTQAKSQSEAPQASFSLKDPLTWGVLGAFALSSFLSVSLLTQLSRGTQEEGARRSTQLVLGLSGAFGTWPLLLGALGVVAGSGLLFVQPRRLRGVPAALAILGALLTLSFAVGAVSPASGGAISGWLAGAGAFGRIAAFAAAVVLGLGTVLAGFEALGLDSSGIRGSLRRLVAVGNLSAVGAAIASRTKRAPQESSPTASGKLPLDEDTEDPHAVQPARDHRPSQPEPAGVSEPAGEQPAGSNLAGAAEQVEDRDVVRPLSRRPGSVAAQPARAVVDVPQPTSPGADESGEPKPHVAADAGLDELVVRHISPAATEKRPVIEPDLGETHEPRAMSTNAVEAAASRVGQRTEDPNPGPMAPIATEDPQPLFAAEAQAESSAAVAEPPRVSSNAQRVAEQESEWAEVEALIATPTAELVDEVEAPTAEEVASTVDESAGDESAGGEEVDETQASTATAPEVEETAVDSEEEEWDDDENAELEDEEWEESDEEEAEEDVEEGAWDEAEGAEEGDEEEWEEGDEEEGEWDSAEDEDGEWEESEEEEWEEEPATAEASAEAEEDSDEEWEEEDGEDEEWDESAEWEEGDEEEAEEEAEEPAVAELEEAPEEAPAAEQPAATKSAGKKAAGKKAAGKKPAADVTTAESLTQNDLFGEASAEDAGADPDPTPAPLPEEEPAEVAAEAASEPIVELQPAAPDRERLILEAGLMFIRAERVAVSMLQRTYDMDFDESTAILDELQQRGLIGPYMGGKQRDILLDEAAWSAIAAG